MPRGDRTGPSGMGPMTGRAAGICAGYDRPGFANPGVGGGYRLGRGMGRRLHSGFGRGFGRDFGYRHAALAYPQVPMSWNAPSREQELEALKAQAANYEQGLEEINRRIGELEIK